MTNPVENTSSEQLEISFSNASLFHSDNDDNDDDKFYDCRSEPESIELNSYKLKVTELHKELSAQVMILLMSADPKSMSVKSSNNLKNLETKCTNLLSDLEKEINSYKDGDEKSINERINDALKNLADLPSEYTKAVYKNDSAFMSFLKSLAEKIVNLFQHFYYQVLKANPSDTKQLQGAAAVILNKTRSGENSTLSQDESTTIQSEKLDEAIELHSKDSKIDGNINATVKNVLGAEPQDSTVDSYVKLIIAAKNYLEDPNDSTKMDIRGRAVDKILHKPKQSTLSNTFQNTIEKLAKPVLESSDSFTKS